MSTNEKDEARTSKPTRWKEALCQRVVTRDLQSTSAYPYQMSDLRNEKLEIYSDLCNDLQYCKCTVCS